ncbi:hypothetical protein GIB67_005136 [Kingdonia uniflora]|uniref:F-box protein n=1 Tax=Kingdonia uniflora TaxID=39325 RepID=A0A7J7LAA3_9MAGN|nr:hypothetical protein GIB67_005136 [Kingdonia uniflora]
MAAEKPYALLSECKETLLKAFAEVRIDRNHMIQSYHHFGLSETDIDLGLTSRYQEIVFASNAEDELSSSVSDEGKNDDDKNDNVVDRILLRRGGLNVNTFTLEIVKASTVSRMNDWISYAVTRNIQELRVEIQYYLLKASFHIHDPIFDKDGIGYLLTKVLKAINNTEILHLSGYFIKSLSTMANLPACLPTSCPNLKHVYLHILPIENHVQVMASLLNGCPNLTLLVIHFSDWGESSETYTKEGHWEKEFCSVVAMLDNIKEVRFVFFDGSEFVIDNVKLLNENANALKKIVLHKFEEHEAKSSKDDMGF